MQGATTAVLGEVGSTIVNGKLDTVEISNEDRGDRCGKVGAEGREEGRSVSADDGGMEMDEA